MKPVRARRSAVMLALFAALLVSGRARADLDTDRPAFTETPLSTRSGHVQVEMGATAAAGRGEVSALRAPEGLVRIGLVNRIELRLGYDHGWLWDDGDFDRDEARAAIGAKFQLLARGEVWGAALIPVYAFDPDDFENTDRLGIGLPWSYELNTTTRIAGALGYERNGSTDESRGSFTLVAHRELHPHHAGFLEWAVDMPEGGRTTNVMHFGYTLDTSETTQFDVHGGIGVGEDAPDAFLGLGFAVLF